MSTSIIDMAVQQSMQQNPVYCDTKFLLFADGSFTSFPGMVRKGAAWHNMQVALISYPTYQGSSCNSVYL